MSLILGLSSVSHSEIHTALIAEDLSFLSPDYDAGSKNFSFVGAHVKSSTKSDDVFKIDLKGEYAIGNSVLSYLNIKEIYYTFNIDETSKINFGRKINNWSAIDQTFNRGIFQPQFRWNQLNPETQGLTGLFYEKNTSSYGLTLFATPLFIPDQGASYEIKDGQFQSGNPFFHAPPQNIKFQGQVLPIDYDIHKPETSDVVFQSQLGAQFRYGGDKGFFGNVAGIYKPANQLALGYKGILVTTRVRVDVTPKTFYENDYSADLGYRDSWGYVQLSALSSTPKNPDFDSTYNAPQFESGTSWGPQVLYKWKPFKFFLAYFDTVGGKVTDVGPDVSSDRESLSNRFLYNEAALARVTYTDTFFKEVRLDSTLQYKFSPKEKFREIRFRNFVSFKGPWSVWADMILIDTDSSVATGYESYKNLDQLWLGVSYDL
ncbi:MAG: hypothetical protein ACXVBD_08835 [Pseudobdellovibrio sp.]